MIQDSLNSIDSTDDPLVWSDNNPLISTAINNYQQAYKNNGVSAIALNNRGSANRQDPQVQARNIGYALDSLHTAARLGCTRFLFSGSQAEYGIVDGVMGEGIVCHPVSEYGKDKLEVCRRGFMC